jgi:hypothetical protein
MDEIADTNTVTTPSWSEEDFACPKRQRTPSLPQTPESVKVTLIVRPRLGVANWAQACLVGGSTKSARDLLRTASAQPQGADPRDMEKVAEFARENKMSVLQSNATRRWIVVEGDAAAVGKAFGVDLGEKSSQPSRPSPFETPVRAPRPLAGIVEAVLGLYQPNGQLEHS